MSNQLNPFPVTLTVAAAVILLWWCLALLASLWILSKNQKSCTFLEAVTPEQSQPWQPLRECAAAHMEHTHSLPHTWRIILSSQIPAQQSPVWKGYEWVKCCEPDLWMCNSFTALECCESAVAAASTAVLLCSETNRRSALRLWRAPGSQVPECSLLIMQPPCQLSKLATRTVWEHGDIIAHFTHVPSLFGQIAMHKRSTDSNGTLPSCVSVYDSGEFIQASPSKYRRAIALLWSAKPYGCACIRHCCLFVCTHDYSVKRVQAVFMLHRWDVITPPTPGLPCMLQNSQWLM